MITPREIYYKDFVKSQNIIKIKKEISKPYMSGLTKLSFSL